MLVWGRFAKHFQLRRKRPLERLQSVQIIMNLRVCNETGPLDIQEILRLQVQFNRHSDTGADGTAGIDSEIEGEW